MTEQERQDIIECLKYQKSISQLQPEKDRIQNLINVTKNLTCSINEHIINLPIDELIDKCCEILNYEATKENNKSRDYYLVEKRKAIAWLCYMANGYSPSSFNMICRKFGKHRTSMNHYINSAEGMLKSNDAGFRFTLDKLLKSDALFK